MWVVDIFIRQLFHTILASERDPGSHFGGLLRMESKRTVRQTDLTDSGFSGFSALPVNPGQKIILLMNWIGPQTQRPAVISDPGVVLCVLEGTIMKRRSTVDEEDETGVHMTTNMKDYTR